MGRHQNIRHLVKSYLLRNAGQPVTADELQAATGLSIIQIQSQMRNMVKEGEPVTVVSRARIWTYQPEPEPEPEDETNPDDPTGEIYEGIGRTRAGKVIVRDGNGVLFILEDLDL